MIIGISGGSGAGKSTTSRILSNIIPDSQLIVVDVLMHKYSFQYEDVILSKMNVNTDHKIHCYNYFHDSFEKIKIWIDTIKDYVVTDINKIIEENPNKNYIIDWCYLPLCDLYKKCNYTICVKSNFEDRKKRLTNRLKNLSNSKHDKYNIPYSMWTPDAYDKSIEFSDLSNQGYSFDYYIHNDSTIENLTLEIDNLAQTFLSNK